MVKILAAIWTTAWVTYAFSLIGVTLPAKEVSDTLPISMFILIGTSMFLGWATAREDAK